MGLGTRAIKQNRNVFLKSIRREKYIYTMEGKASALREKKVSKSESRIRGYLRAVSHQQNMTVGISSDRVAW